MAGLSRSDRAVAFQAASILLRHPDEATPVLSAVRDAVAGLPLDIRGPLADLSDHLAAGGARQLAAEYTEIFDFSRMCSMYLTYFRFGDTRQRGAALVRFTAAYRTAGLELESGELPDYLPMVLEFAATADLDAGTDLLTSFRSSIDVLCATVAEKSAPYAAGLEAVRRALPPATARDTTLAERILAEGPPSEDVGLAAQEPYSLDPALLAGSRPQ